MSRSSGGWTRFLRELRRRKVARVAVVYGATAFVVVQVASFVFPALLLPDVALRVLVVLAIFGFPIALVLAWAFEVTPQGIQRTDEADAGEAAPAGEGDGRPASPWLPLPLALLAGGMLLVGGGVWWLSSGDASTSGWREGNRSAGTVGGTGGSVDAPVVHLAVTLPRDQELVPGPGSPVAISPGGDLLVYAAMRADTSHLFLRPLDRPDATILPGTAGAGAPFFSPDGRWIGFFSGGELRKVSVEGGAPLRVTEHPWPGGSWGPDDTLVVGNLMPGGHRGLSRVDAGGGGLRAFTTQRGFRLERPEQAHLWPQVLPGGKKVLFTAAVTPEAMSVHLHDLESGETRRLVDAGTSPRFLAPDVLLYAWGGDVLAARLDPESGELRGTPVPVLDGVAVHQWGGAHYDVSRTGTLVRVPGRKASGGARFAWVALDGTHEALPYPPGSYGGPRIAPDGRRFVASRREDRVRVWVFDPGRSAARRLTGRDPMEFWPVWSPDGRHVLHNSNLDGGPSLDLYRREVDGSGPPERLTDQDGNAQPRAWTPGGDTLIYTLAGGETGFDIWLLSVEGEGPPSPLVATPADESHPVLSPDGRWLAYASNRSGRMEVYVRSFPDGRSEAQVSNSGGGEPVWSPAGDRLYFRSRDGQSVYVAPFRVERPAEARGPLPRVGEATRLFTGPFQGPSGFAGRNYDLSPDGERFLMLREEEGEPWMEASRIDVILNWRSELERRLTASSPRERRGRR